jgi:catechol 2,3-dioxygenase-like lactoylglutathione lyase family enzyme
MRFTVDRIDHIVLTCTEIETSASWYQRVLGMEREEFGTERRTALKFGGQKINLHQRGEEVTPHARAAAPGTADVCFIAAVGTDEIMDHLRDCGVTVELGPVNRAGAFGPISSVYCRDPDGNLIEVSSYLHDD